MEIFQTIAVWHRQGMALREMARRLALNVKTVRRIVTKIDAGGKQLVYTVRASKLDPFAERIHELAASGRTARSIFGELAEAPSFPACYDLVRRWVARLRQRDPKVYERLEHPPGAEVQVDFATLMRVRSGARMVTAHAFIITWPHSHWVYEDVVIDQTVPTFLGAIQDAIWESGSPPGRLTPDNLKSAVLRRQLVAAGFTAANRQAPRGWGSIASILRYGTAELYADSATYDRLQRWCRLRFQIPNGALNESIVLACDSRGAKYFRHGLVSMQRAWNGINAAEMVFGVAADQAAVINDSISFQGEVAQGELDDRKWLNFDYGAPH